MINFFSHKFKKTPDPSKRLPTKASLPPEIPYFAVVFDSNSIACATWENQTEKFRDTFLRFASEIEITTTSSGIPEYAVYRLSPQAPGVKVVWHYKNPGWDTSVMIHGS